MSASVTQAALSDAFATTFSLFRMALPEARRSVFVSMIFTYFISADCKLSELLLRMLLRQQRLILHLWKRKAQPKLIRNRSKLNQQQRIRVSQPTRTVRTRSGSARDEVVMICV